MDKKDIIVYTENMELLGTTSTKRAKKLIKCGNAIKYSNTEIILTKGKSYLKNAYSELKEERGYCYICGSNIGLTIDHVIPISKGGSNDKSNLRLACEYCNSFKADKTIQEFILEIEDNPSMYSYISEEHLENIKREFGVDD